MSNRRLSVVIAAAALMSAASAHAWAGDKPVKPADFTVKSEPLALAPNAFAPNVGRVFKWDASKGKIGFTLDMLQPTERPAVANDIQAGAYYRITPSLRVGGAVAFGDQQPLPGPKPASPEAGQPRVQLETKFKF
jgi:hypothetical protein